MLLSITKLQNLKAIHNTNTSIHCKVSVVVNHKTTKFESNSQLSRIAGRGSDCCCQSQNYKIWKQFTTKGSSCWKDCLLLSITKLQNLKAIHNKSLSSQSLPFVVVNHKTTKFESNSQLHCKKFNIRACCCQSQNYKIWKQFTTACQKQIQKRALLSITKLQNLKAIHNRTQWAQRYGLVVVNHKTTKFESNSQQTSSSWFK